MEETKFNIIIVDGAKGEEDSFIAELKFQYVDTADVSCFTQTDDAMSFIEEHLSERMVIIMIDKLGSSFIESAIKVRGNNSLVPIIISTDNISKLSSKDVMTMINTENFFIINNSDIIGAKEIIDRIRYQWIFRFDNILEQWLIRHPEDNSKEAFSEASTGKTYTWEDILVELRKQTPVGKSFEQMLNEYYIYQLNRSKK